MFKRLALSLLPVTAALMASSAHAQWEPFGADIGPWTFTQSSEGAVTVCRAVYRTGGKDWVFGRKSSGNNWVSLPANVPKGKFTDAMLGVGDNQAELITKSSSDGNRVWLEWFDTSMFDKIARKRGYEWAVSPRQRGKVAIDGNGAAAFKRVAECLAANSPAPKPAAKAAPAKGRMIYPDYPGASQSCVVPVDPQTRKLKVAPLAELVLTNATSEAQCQLFVVSKQRISIAGRPELCVNVGAGARSGYLYLEACKDVSVTGWDAAGTATSSARIRALGGPFDNQCWTIPKLADEKAKFPIPVLPADCQKNAAKELKFYVE